MFGPYDGHIEHEPEDRSLEAYRALEVAGDVLIEAVFVNPYSDPDLKWEHGFLFRRGESNHFYSTTLESTADWEHYARMGDDGVIGFADYPRQEINVGAGEENLFQVALVGDTAWVYTNGTFTGQFPADLDTGGNGIRLIADDDHEGITVFKEAAVWRWSPSMYRDFPEVDPSYVAPPSPTPTITPTPNPSVPIFGPDSGRITHDEGDDRFEIYPGLAIDGDIMVEVTFEVPFAPNESHWNFGLWFDSERSGAFHIVELNSLFGGGYNHWRKSGPDESWQGRISEDVVGINLQKGEKNHVRVILLDRKAWLYVNDRRMGILNFSLGDIPAPNWIGLVVNDFEGQGFRYSIGGHTKFEDFTVWKWHPSLFELPDDD